MKWIYRQRFEETRTQVNRLHQSVFDGYSHASRNQVKTINNSFSTQSRKETFWLKKSWCFMGNETQSDTEVNSEVKLRAYNYVTLRFVKFGIGIVPLDTVASL